MPLQASRRRRERARAGAPVRAAAAWGRRAAWLALPALVLLFSGCGLQPGSQVVTLQPSSVQVAASPTTSAGPLQGQTVSGVVDVTVDADSWAGEVRFYLDQQPGAGTPIADDTSRPYTATIDTTTLADGAHSLAVEEIHANPNAAKTATVSVDFTVDNGGGSSGSGGGGSSTGAGTVYWQYGFENGTVSPFQTWGSGDSSVSVVGSPAHGGSGHAAGMTITTSSTKSGMRLAVPYLQDGSRLPTSAYYSAWYYLPRTITTPWDNIFQFKQHDNAQGSSNPVWTIVIGNRSNGAIRLSVTDHVGTDGTYNGAGSGQRAVAPVDVPVGRWFHLECLYTWSTSDGRVTCWQDGQLLWDLTGEVTDFGYAPYDGSGGDLSRQFTVNNYAASTSPSTTTIYVDDVAITSARTGP